ncbi:MAG: energy-coupling factor ABC transporter ATP-binding protein [Deltaproteobacteria bacterium]|jgi:cobalt/nickel transport system ATP-binding protein|nr:energy-coupling factor ABC transporter ATP-binding protein [Deltaproteobacteria bacterium]
MENSHLSHLLREKDSLIELNGIVFGYPNRPPILKGADLYVGKEDKVALTGHNGSGKTTILSIIMGLNKPQGGEVFLLGKKRVTEKDFQPVRPLLGFVFQDANDQLFSPTVADDIAFGPLNLGHSKKEAQEIVEWVLGLLGLEGFENRVTHDLSGGEKKLVALGTALALKPKMLILDEPSTFLDINSQERILEIILNLNLPFLLVSHDWNFIRKTGCRYLQMREGQIQVLEKPPDPTEV